MVHHTVRKLRGLPVRVVGFVNEPTRFVAALLTLAVLCAVIDVISNSQQSEPATEPQDVVGTRAAELDDPVGFKTFALQQQGYSGSAEAVGHRSSGKSRLSSKTGHICENTCVKANDGVCDEGRRGNLTVDSGTNWVFCDLGTDCQDCGPWQGVQHGPAWSEGMGPIAYLRLYKIEVRVKQVPYEPKFMFAFTDPQLDKDQSEHMNVNSVVEPGISQVFYKVLSKQCKRDAPGSSGFVVDVGGNYGWFSLLSASLGCSVLTIEPVPIFRAFMEYSSARNHLTPLIELLPAVVALDTTKVYTINAPLIPGAQWGASGMDVPNHPGSIQVPARAVHLDDLAYPKRSSFRALLDRFSIGDSSKGPGLTLAASTGNDDGSSLGSTVSMVFNADADNATSGGAAGNTSSADMASQKLPVLMSRLLPAWLPRGIDILKVDVEGREPDVFATATKLLGSGQVANIILEYSPGYYYQVTDRLVDMELLPALLMEIARHNYSMVHIPWGIAHDTTAMRLAKSWDTALPTMDVITTPQLAYDLWTTEHIKNGTLPGMHGPSSWPCPEMAKSGMRYGEPGPYERLGMHIGFHPKAFMANFVFNTNVWASKDKSLQVPGTNLFNDRDMFPFYYPANARWFPQSATSDTHLFGLPWAFCQDVPPKFQVAHRCRCRVWDVCGQHQVAVQQCVLKKHTGYDVLADDQVGTAIAKAAAIMAARAQQASSHQ